MKKHIFCLALLLFLALAAAPAQAHMLWLNPADCYPAVRGTVEIGIGWGHEFTASRTHEEVKPESPYAGIVVVADTVSAVRPGARAESLTSYIERLNATFRARISSLARRGRALVRRPEHLEAWMWVVWICR